MEPNLDKLVEMCKFATQYRHKLSIANMTMRNSLIIAIELPPIGTPKTNTGGIILLSLKYWITNDNKVSKIVYFFVCLDNILNFLKDFVKFRENVGNI